MAGDNTMRHRRCMVALVFCATVVAAVVTTDHAHAVDGQYRGYLRASKDVGIATVRLASEGRATGSVDNEDYYSAALGLERGLGDHFRVGASYSEVRTKSGGEWKTERRPYADLTIRWQLGAAELSDRSRVEWRHRDGDTILRYRNRIRGVVALGAAGWRGAFDGEAFYDLEEGEVNTIRLTAGPDVKVTEAVRIGLTYVHETRLKSEKWTRVHCLGLALSLDMK